MHSTTTATNVAGGIDTTTSPTDDLEENALQISHGDKFYSRLLSKESSAANPSLRGYFRVAPAAIPFTWESTPGTPKNTPPASSLPPLTPPPSYQLRLVNKPRDDGTKKQFGFLSFAGPGVLSVKKPHGWLSMSSVSSSSDSSSTISPTRRRHRKTLSSDVRSPGSISCFGFRMFSRG